MDLRLSQSEEAFRNELRAWLEADDPGEEPTGEQARFDFGRDLHRRLYAAGWAGPTWPVEHGGRGATLVEQAVYEEEMVNAGISQPANIVGLLVIGPLLIAYGTKDQQLRFLQPMLSADDIWCEGFSEPDAGSDLGALKTRAVLEGGEWVVHGQKIWTSLARHAKWCLLLARTDPDAKKHKGLTCFALDLEQEGVEVRPIKEITGDSEFNEVFFEGARIPQENVIGEPGNGWMMVMTALAIERANVPLAVSGQTRIALSELIELARERGVADDPYFRDRIARLQIETEALRLTSWRGLTKLMKKGVPGPEGSLAKWHWSEISQAITELALEIRGADAPITDSEWTYRFIRARGYSLEAGSTEIQKNIVAEHALGLPKFR